MSHELICNWLGLRPDEWPPDHYRLLGLNAGEGNTALIEQRVHERLDTVRCYQMLHPEQATEAMNRLAQAFVCLTEPNSKKVYDANLPGAGGTVATAVKPPPVISASDMETVIDFRDPLGFLTATTQTTQPPPLPGQPPPLPNSTVKLGPGSTITSERPPAPNGEQRNESSSAGTRQDEIAVPPQLPVLTSSLEAADPIADAAQSSPAARRGLGTKRALYHRIARTRQLLRVRDEIGQHLVPPRQRALRRTEIADLLEKISQARKLLRRFPPLLGAAGQPGYHVLVLAQLDPAQLQKFNPSQRETLAQDWKAGRKLLTTHRDFLRQETRALRKRTFLQLVSRAIRSFWADHPTIILLLLSIAAIVIAYTNSRP